MKINRVASNNNLQNKSSSYANVMYRNLEDFSNEKDLCFTKHNFDKNAEDNLEEYNRAQKFTTGTMPKSHSFSGFNMPRTIVTQDSVSEKTTVDILKPDDFNANFEYPSTNSFNIEEDDEQNAFLNNFNAKTLNLKTKSTSKKNYLKHSLWRRDLCFRYLVPFVILVALVFIAYFTREYVKELLYWIETQNLWIKFSIFILLFVIVSFPVVVGYFVLMITTGYLFGFLKGLLTVILGANIGIAIAHSTIKAVKHRIPMQSVLKHETGTAILRVLSGPKALRVLLLTRLTPIPFGVQNTIFGISSINRQIYHLGSFLGLLPAQIINTYLGSTLRSMHEVLSHGTAFTSYAGFIVEVICGVGLMIWVVRKARKELTSTLLPDVHTNEKLIAMQV